MAAVVILLCKCFEHDSVWLCANLSNVFFTNALGNWEGGRDGEQWGSANVVLLEFSFK